MALQYKFTHLCGHTAIGPLIERSTRQPYSLAESSSQAVEVTAIQLPLSFECPFCLHSSGSTSLTATSNAISLQNIAHGLGVLCVLEVALHPASHLNTWTWKIIKSCLLSEITFEDWAQGNSTGAQGIGRPFEQVVWIAKPCGGVGIIGGERVLRRDGTVQMGVITQVKSTWRQGIGQSGEAGEEVKSRFAGMLSQLHAAVLSGERAGRYD